MAQIKQQYALNELNELVAIENVSIDDRNTHHYHCLNCGAEMIPRQGNVRTWHFAHKGNDDHCSAETYLHKLAKRLVKEKFDTSETFNIGYYQDTTCSYIKSCPFAKLEECHTKLLKIYNLKKWYDTCEEEITIGDYIADIVLNNSKRPDLAPILIEIQVSHKSTEQKTSSGLRIIEIRVDSEDSIRKILETTINEHPDTIFDYVRDVKTIGYAKFYGFGRNNSMPEPLELRKIPKFFLFPSGKTYVTNLSETPSCRSAWEKTNNYSIFEASIDCFYLNEPSPFEYGLIVASKYLNKSILNCQLCKYHRNGFDSSDNPIFCCLYQKYGTPKYPKSGYAVECQFYKEDRELISIIENTMPPIVIAGTPNTDGIQSIQNKK